MTIDEKIRNENLQYDINREDAEISALSSKKIDKYEHFTGEEIPISSDQRRMIASSVYLFSFRESFKRAKRNDWRSRQEINKTYWRA